ncbi:TLC domain-containing protein 2 [Canna indica]|uniref:TLC domain-containing protein 2 n=1 Tax=Canna indica TaxID=4628 RepID=A0AAQ3Q393_9LILI|nr:TLC domain-containing protein 2 [Canna indica]
MPPSRGRAGGSDPAVFFAATLVLWGVSVAFEITVNGRSELAPVVAGFFFFQAANWAARLSLSRDPLLVNTAVSLLHSTVTSASVVLILINQLMTIKGIGNMFEHEQLVGGSWLGAYSALCFSCGYFAYDQLDMLRYHLYSGLIPGILVHHLVLLVCFTLALYRNVTINYLILTLTCELHSVFLHLRKVRRMAGFRDVKSRMVKVEWVLNWITFFITRVGCHIFITYKLIVDASKFGRGIELPLALFGMAGMNVLNIILGFDLYKAYNREKNQQRHQE